MTLGRWFRKEPWRGLALPPDCTRQTSARSLLHPYITTTSILESDEKITLRLNGDRSYANVTLRRIPRIANNSSSNLSLPAVACTLLQTDARSPRVCLAIVDKSDMNLCDVPLWWELRSSNML
jgi:hypothetical protein